MSNALAVPAVTAALLTIVQAAIDRLGLIPRPIVAPGPLDRSGENAGVGVHLYRVTQNPALSVTALPSHPAGGSPRQQGQVALDLHYLLTFHGNSEWEAQQLLATTAAVLHVEPVLTAARIAGAEAEHPEIAGNDLGAAEEPVRVSSETLSVDELNGLWALYPTGSFTVTLAVSAGPVLIDGDPSDV